MGERCQERERLLSRWTDCSNHVRKLGDEQVAAIKDGSTQMFHGNAVPGFASFGEKIWLAKLRRSRLAADTTGT